MAIDAPFNGFRHSASRKAQRGCTNRRSEQFKHVQCDFEPLPQFADQAVRGDAAIRECPSSHGVGRQDRKTFLKLDAAVISINRERCYSAGTRLSLDPGEDNIQVCRATI